MRIRGQQPHTVLQTTAGIQEQLPAWEGAVGCGEIPIPEQEKGGMQGAEWVGMGGEV